MYCYTLNELPKIAAELLARAVLHPVICFDAPMGAGKTTLVAAVCALLGVPATEVSSPTYSLANEYVGGDGQRIFHLDCYRIAHPNEAIDAGIEEYFHTQKALCFVEWYQVVAPLLPQSYWLATIKVLSATERSISFELITNK